VEAILSIWQLYVLAMGRVAAFIMLAPVIGGRNVPRTVKIFIVLILTAVGLGLSGVLVPVPILTLPVFSFLLIKEVLVGFVMGLTIMLVLFSCQAAGEFMGFQMMFSAGATFLAHTNERSTIIGNFFYITAILVFVTIDGHHWLIQGLNASFRTLPVLATPASLGSLSTWIELTGRLFEIGMQLALPIMVTLFITNLMLGMIAKTMPQLNIFIVGLPIQISVAFILLFIMIHQLLFAEVSLFHNWAREFYGLIKLMAP